MLLGFLPYEAGVERPGEVLRQVDTKEFGLLDNLHGGAVNVQRQVVVMCLLSLSVGSARFLAVRSRGVC